MRETLNLTEEDGLQALRMHLQERARVARLRYPDLGQESSLRALLRDGEIVRFPVELRFGTEGLIPGEFAHAEPKEDRAAAGFTLFVHPQFEGRWADSGPARALPRAQHQLPGRGRCGRSRAVRGHGPGPRHRRLLQNAFVPWRMNWDPLRWIPLPHLFREPMDWAVAALTSAAARVRPARCPSFLREPRPFLRG
ncbi:MAG: hypothetical protein R3E96_01860 [Planctomycetota bacterium]